MSNKAQKAKTALYEVVFVVKSEASRQDIDKVADELLDVLKELGGKQVKREYWGLRGLAYKIQKASKGHYMLLGLEATAEAIAEISRKLRINETIIRNMVTRVDAIEDKPSAIMRSYDDGESADAA